MRVSYSLVAFYSDFSTILSGFLLLFVYYFFLVFVSINAPEKKDDGIETAKKEEEMVEKSEGTIKLTLTHMHVSL